MNERTEDHDDLLNSISRNVEANLSSIHQRSAWETALSNKTHTSSSRDVVGNGDNSTFQLNNDFSLEPRTTSIGSSLDMQNWPSPVTGPSNINSNNNYRLIRDSTAKDDPMTPLVGMRPKVSTPHANKVNIKQNMTSDESTFLRPDSLRSSSMLSLADIFSQHILLHPFVALRRTCQVNRRCSAFICVQPFSLLPFLYHKQSRHGLPALYKGLSSTLLVKGIVLGTETALANYTNWPREVQHSRRFLSESVRALALRGISIALSTPFLCTAVIETVQSVIVVKDRPSFVDCLKDGFLRLLHLRSTPSNRMLPIWLFVVPTAFYYISHSGLSFLANKFVNYIRSTSIMSDNLRKNQKIVTKRKQKTIFSDSTEWQRDTTYESNITLDTSAVDAFEEDSKQISTSIVANLVADFTLLPVETVLYRLYIQGTRTIIDNCDETTVVLPVLTNYDGFKDCYQSIIKFEGTLGLYKGLGAIVLQYSIHFLIFRSLYYLLREFHSTGNANQLKSAKNAHKNSLLRPQQPHSKPPSEVPTIPQPSTLYKINGTDYMSDEYFEKL